MHICPKQAPLLLMLPLCGSALAQSAEPAEIAETIPEHLAYFYELETHGQEARGVYASKRTWEPGDTLKVCFFGGNPIVKKVIATIAPEWSKWGNVTLDFGSPPAWRNCRNSSDGFSLIRIGFASQGYWSAIGTDSDSRLNANQPSMNFQGFDMRYSEGPGINEGNVASHVRPRDSGTILHEFGHALGLLHEAQNPALNCLNEIRFEGADGAYAYYGRPPNNWNRETVDRNLGPIWRVDPDATGYKADVASIEMYPIPASILYKGTASPCYTGENNQLSDGDKRLIANLYPRTAEAPSDSNLRMTSTAAPALPAARAQNADRIERIKADLQSDVATVRREARRQLALTMRATEGEAFSELLGEFADSNYRGQLGAVVAIANADALPQLTPEQLKAVKADLLKIQKGSRDKTLTQAAKDASAALGMK